MEFVSGREDASEVRGGEDADALARRPGDQAQAVGAKVELLGRFLARGVQHGTGRGRLAQDARRGLEHERRLADPRLTTQQHQGTRHEAAAEDAVHLADAHRQPADRRGGDVAEGHGRLGPRQRAPRHHPRPARADGPGRRIVSTRESHAPQWWQRPSHRAELAPQAWQT